MRKFLFMLAALAASLAATPSHALLIQLLPSAMTPLTGSSFSVQVAVSDFGGGEVTAFGFDVVSTPGIAWTSALLHPAFDDESAIFGGVAGSAFPGVVGESLVLATLAFDALAPGAATIGIVSNLTDPSRGLFVAELAGALDLSQSIGIAIQPISEPAGLFLLGALLVGLAGWMRHARPTQP
jgi:hypothetical protein